MKICLSTKQFFDDEGRPLSDGRISVYLHGSDTLADIYTMNGDDYMPEMNPFYCYGDGRVPAVFFDASVVDVKVESSNGDGTWSLVDTYQDGFDMPQGTSDTLVTGIAALKDVQPEEGMVVTVSGYDSTCFAPTRHYVYDPTATEPADDGVVIESDHGDGRWLLLWDCDSLPCTVYGIVPGSEANISAFLSFPDHLGQWDLRTPPKARFLEGDYTSNTTFSTTKCLKFDAGTRFIYASFVVPCIEADNDQNYIADFYFSGAVQDVAESGWFRTFKEFLTCNAKTINFGADNFEDKVIDTAVAVVDKNVTGRGRIPATYSDGGYIKFSNCNITAYKFLTPSLDYVQFSYARWSDDWWTSTIYTAFDFGTIAGGNRLEFTTAKNDTIDCGDFCVFGNANRYANAMKADLSASPLTASKTLDLCGKFIYGDFDASGFTEIRNAYVGGKLTLDETEVRLVNVHANGVKFTGTSLNVTEGSNIILSDGSTIANLYGSDSTIARATAWDVNPLISLYRCTWDVPLHTATDNTTDCQPAGFVDCYIHDCTIRHKKLTLTGCTIRNADVELYPYMDGATPKVSLTMTGCTYVNGNPLYIGRFIDNTDATGKNVVSEVSITGNYFGGNTKGVSMPFYALMTNRSLFLKAGALDGFVYHANGGLCPAESAQANLEDDWTSTTAYDTDISASGYVSSTEIRAFPMFSQLTAMTTLGFGRMTQEYTLTNYGQDISADGKTGSHLVHSVQLTPWNDEDHNDFFSLRYYAGSNPNKRIVIM